MPPIWRLMGLLGLTALLSACAGRSMILPDQTQLRDVPQKILLTDVRFHPQDEYQCGPAALAMVLNHQGLPDTPEQLVERVYIPQREGSLQVEMVAAARERDLLAYPLAGKIESVIQEVAAGNPVLVMQNLALNWYPQWHYAVVIGYDLERQVMILHSGLNAEQREPFRLFSKTWNRADNWARVMLPPDQLPATAEPLPYLTAASELEQTGKLESARTAYTTALKQWPDQPAARFGLGNVAWAQGQREEAARHFLRLTKEHPGLTVGWNNLAVTLDALDCEESAKQARHCGTGPSDCPPAFHESLFKQCPLH
ncbi:PA2778 family cysteine peptidase [Pseudomonas sp. OIL-1]|uniref:PA2778 family cysteine peptidase n=1 Tax=Pseudomonas sp. OIL-1 TaxID=2706126 RepID=UPI0013A73403|nr:PA2778 family cysteine peptidase [Pseudomonas sp. OIL-1]QIB51868.1 PA2778 family cysteine peptidase [Pseudomonas sp. OIL-1]